jgi:hypothetical protein
MHDHHIETGNLLIANAPLVPGRDGRDREIAPTGRGGAVAVVVFDLGGVVFRYLPERRLAMLAELTGRSTTQIRKTLMDSGYSRSCDAGRLDVEGAYREGIRLLGQRLSLDRFAGLWTSAF